MAKLEHQVEVPGGVGNIIVPPVIEPAAYIPNPKLLVVDKNLAKNFYCPSRYDETLPVSKILYTYSNSVLLSLFNFKDNNDNCIVGTKAVNSWDVKESLNYYFLDDQFSTNPGSYSYGDTSETADFVARGSFVNFSAKRKLIELSGIFAGTLNRIYCKLYVKNDQLHLETYKRTGPYYAGDYALDSIYSYSPEDFSDHILPRRLIVIMQGAGGGGGGAWGDESKNGGGGGSGGYFACVINTEILWASSSNCYKFYIGSAGAGGQEGGTSDPVNAGPGGDSKMTITVKNGIYIGSPITTTTLLIAGGGGGGKTASNKAGTAGIVTDGSGTNLSDITNISGLNKYFWWLPYSNGKSWEHGLDGIPGNPGSTNRTSTNSYTLYNMPLRYSEKDSNNNKMKVGGYQSGIIANAHGGGAGAPSYFSNGGNSGGWAQDTVGKSPSGYGAGGGGSTYLFVVGTATGPDGGQGMLKIYAYGE